MTIEDLIEKDVNQIAMLFFDFNKGFELNLITSG